MIQNNQNHLPREDHWIPLADLMTGLMIIFMLIAISFMIKVKQEALKAEQEAIKVKKIALIYNEVKLELYRDLYQEFAPDLPLWGAELKKDLTLRFKEPKVLFDTGQAALKPRFTAILNDFFPRYIRILGSNKYRNYIEEIRIEGHTSSIWNQNTTEHKAYFLNMALSQSRTRSVLSHVFLLPQIQNERLWLKKHLTANGLSSSKLIYHQDGTENKRSSQRVEFKIKLNADDRIAEILNMVRS
ncbi:OmpA/MotB family protein [Candidatus Nitrosacidococcus tergens]|uniref:OmpA-like domain-containing protein n=1 Tax=Candidatus Nitrosacidococcus tergens TaxID=553981 RepID=A0A7G1Q9V1_9GAMM|nr:OmpA family protein [Candidatus Nitrosacidococcus tergens]CAB1276246.1 conserved protein of unknown function [Candidatus Nitrosacidococcus tergens]